MLLLLLLLLLLGRLLLLWGGTWWSLWGLHSRLSRMLRQLETGLWLGLGLGGSSGGCSWLRACAGHWGHLGQAGLFSRGDPAPLPPCADQRVDEQSASCGCRDSRARVGQAGCILSQRSLHHRHDQRSN